MDLDALLARSRDPGDFVERKSFTLSRSKALSKMRDFTLRSPSQFSLELVQAGVFAGAHWIFVNADRFQATIGWVGGRTLSRPELEKLLDYLFVAEGSSDNRHLRQLAITVNVLLRREPRLLRVESGDAEGSVRLDLGPDGSGTIGIPTDKLHGTYLHVRFSDPWFFQTQTRSLAAERVESECLYSPVPIFVNGDGPYGWDRHLPLSNLMNADAFSFKAHGRDGWLGVAPPHTRDDARVKIVVGGVVVSQRRIPAFGPHVEGVIRDDQLAKTADMSDIVADDNWTRLLRHLQPLVLENLQRHHHPELEVELLELLPDEPDEEEPVADEALEVRPLEEGLTVLGLSTPLPLHALEGMAEEALYWVSTDDVTELRAFLSPDLFPGRVVVIAPSQRQAFANLLHPRRANRILPSDATFVAAQVKKGVEVQEIQCATSIGTLVLRLHERGPLPGWRVRATGVPLLLRYADGRLESTELLLHLSRVSAILHLDAEILDRDEALRDVANSIEAQIWKLAAKLKQPALVRELLSAAIFLQPDEHGHPSVQLPSTWPPEARLLLDLPLVDGGPSTNLLLATLGTDKVIEVESDLKALAAFAAPFGSGHVCAPNHPPRPLIVIEWDGTLWTQAEHPNPNGSIAAVMLMDRFTPAKKNGPPSPHPLFLTARRDPTLDLEPGFRLMATALAVAPDAHLPGDLQDILRLARLVLTPENARLHASDGHPTTVDAIRTGALRVALHGGPHLKERDTVLLSVDEAAVLGPNLRWRFDDPPALWAPEPAPEEWLLTVNVLEEGLEGWIGLRFPYDPTGGLLLQHGLQTHLVGEHQQSLRFHGWLNQLGPIAVLPLIQSHTLDVLKGMLESKDLPPKQEEALCRYAADFASIARLHPECGIPTTLGEALAKRVPVADWGSLYAWLGAPKQHRPALSFTVHGLTGEPIDPAAKLESESSGSVVLDGLRLALSRAGVDSRLSLYLNPDGWKTAIWESGSICISVGSRSPTVRQAESGEPRALGLVLLEAVRLLHAFEARTGTTALDLLALQRAALEAVLAVGRVTSAGE